MLVFTEGAVTEPDYVNYLRRFVRAAPLSLEVDPRHGDPVFLVERAVETLEQSSLARRRGRLEEVVDGVWCLMDVDDHPRLPEARELALRKGIPIAISNPSFELWALLHLEECTANLNRVEARTRLQVHMPRYEKHLDIGRIAGRFTQASDRAQRLTKFHADGAVDLCSNPSSGVYQFVEDVLARSNAHGEVVDASVL